MRISDWSSDVCSSDLLFIMAVPMTLLMAGRGGLLGLRRVFWWAAAPTLLYGVYLTNTRGAFLAVMAMAAVWLWQRRGAVIAGILGPAGLAGMMMLPTRLPAPAAGASSANRPTERPYDGLPLFLAPPGSRVGD